MGDKGPRRRVMFEVRMGADSWEDAATALEQIAFEIRRGGWRGPNGCSGGYDSGYTIEASEDETVTHDSYIEALQAYLPRRRAHSTTEEPRG